MNCQNAETLIMKYMDGEISPIEAKSLNEHILTCNDCKEAFLVYDSMVTEMKAMPLIEAPAGFEMQVMDKITELAKERQGSVYSAKDKAKIHIAGGFACLAGLGALLAAYREPILLTLAKNPDMSEYVGSFRHFSSMVGAQSNEIAAMVSTVFENVDRILTSGAGVLAVGIVALCGIQAVIARRKNR